MHGRIRHIGSLAECDFRDLEQVLEFVRKSLRRTNEPGNAGPGITPEVNWESWEKE